MANNEIFKKAKKYFNENKRNCIIGILVILVVILLIIFIPKFINGGFDKKVESNVIANVNEGIVKNEEFKGLKIDNISLIKNKKTKQYTFTAKVTNVTDSKINIRQLDIVFKNKKGEELITLLGDLGENSLEPKVSKTITASVSDTVDLTKATSKEIKERVKS